MASGEFKKPYAVHASGVIKRRIVALQEQATLEGRGTAALAAYRQILQRLRTDPLQFGEPQYPLVNMRLQVRKCSVRPFVVHFAVGEEYQIVFIKEVHLLGPPDA